MAKQFIFLYIFTAFVCFGGAEQHFNPHKYVINLDKPPIERWKQVAADFKTPLQLTIDHVFDLIPGLVRPLVDKIAAKIDDHFHAPFADEIRGVAKASNITLGDVVLYNIMYDLVTFCTSIITRDSNGMIWHTRNLDYGGLAIVKGLDDLLRNITLRVDFQKGGKTLYSGVTFAGYVGLLTAQKPKVFSVTIDSRQGGGWWRNALLAILDHNIQPMSFIVREVLESSRTFREAMFQLADTVTMANVYYILGGQSGDEGAVISKGRYSAVDIWRLQPAPGRWYMVETNWDHWKPSGDKRRDSAVKMVKNMGQNITMSALFNVISTPPVLNKLTVYQIVMSAAKPDLLTARVINYD